MFIQTTEGQIINLDHIASISRFKARDTDLAKGHYFCEFRMSDGSMLRGHILMEKAEAIGNNSLAASVIPAIAGFSILHYYRDPDIGECVSTEPIIGWWIMPGWECPSPVTVFGHTHGAEAYVLHPDSSISNPNLTRWENYAQWLAEMREKHSEARPFTEVFPHEADI